MSINVRRHQTLNDQGQKSFVPPELNGQFLDHIYETIDDDALPPESKNAFQADPPENSYGSDLSQHSSSSCGYDHQPLINICPGSQIPSPKEQTWELSPHWDPPPPESTVVVAVLDGDKVVSRIQQEDIQPQYKLSTYC